MQRLAILVCALALAAAQAASDEGASSHPAALKPIYARSRRFSIPFSVEPATETERTVEVQLYVSTDQGRNWHKYATVQPEARSFRFVARADGSYWFLVRTKDSKGQVHPQEPLHAELHVIVDTANPVLWLEAEAGEGGTVRVRWDAQDQHLDRASFRLEYAVAGTTRWQPLAAEFASGEATFVPGEAGPVTVRATIADLAKNVTTKSSDVLGRAAAQGLQASDRGTPPNGGRIGTVAEGWHPAGEAGDGMGVGDTADNAAALPAPPGMPERFPDGASQPRGPKNQGETAASLSPVEPPLGRKAEPSEVPSGEESEPPVEESESPTGEDSKSPAREDTRPPAREESEPGGPLPCPEPRMVNTRRFALEYELQSVGPSGVAHVELWQTTDGGNTWSLYGRDEDLTSPMLVTVDGEGTYGYIMVVESGAGLRGPQPQPGDLPELSVAVDLTPPTARLHSVQQRRAGQGGSELVIEWEASDARLAARPITLLAAENPGGPWSILRANLENTGRFVWRLEGEPPEEVYIRLEVRDAAGNRRVCDTTDPVKIERVQPKGRIWQVRPLEGTSRAPRVYRFR